MILRRAIKRATDILAECPHGAVCSYLQAGQAQMWFSCGYYMGLKKEGNHWMARCSLQRTKTS